MYFSPSQEWASPIPAASRADKTKVVKESPPVPAKPVKAVGKKERITAEEVQKNLSRRKKTVQKKKEIPTQYEIAKKEVAEKVGGEIGKSAAHVPDDSSTIVKKTAEEAAPPKEKLSREYKAPPPKKKEPVVPAAAAVKEERPSPPKRKRIKIPDLGESLKKGSQKVSGAIVKPFKSDKIQFGKWAGSVVDVSKQPAKSISAMDRKITRSIKKAVIFGDSRSRTSGSSVLKNIKSADARITKSVRKLIDSLLG